MEAFNLMMASTTFIQVDYNNLLIKFRYYLFILHLIRDYSSIHNTRRNEGVTIHCRATKNHNQSCLKKGLDVEESKYVSMMEQGEINLPSSIQGIAKCLSKPLTIKSTTSLSKGVRDNSQSKDQNNEKKIVMVNNKYQI